MLLFFHWSMSKFCNFFHLFHLKIEKLYVWTTYTKSSLNMISFQDLINKQDKPNRQISFVIVLSAKILYYNCCLYQSIIFKTLFSNLLTDQDKASGARKCLWVVTWAHTGARPMPAQDQELDQYPFVQQKKVLRRKK